MEIQPNSAMPSVRGSLGNTILRVPTLSQVRLGDLIEIVLDRGAILFVTMDGLPAVWFSESLRCTERRAKANTIGKFLQ